MVKSSDGRMTFDDRDANLVDAVIVFGGLIVAALLVGSMRRTHYLRVIAKNVKETQ